MKRDVDVVVVGAGAAGIAAAIEAASRGAQTVVVERFEGGGASALSGGVIYLGGGTPIQRQAGAEDSAEQMLAYLRAEANGVVADETLQRFVGQSLNNFGWLEAQGVPFSAELCPFKTAYPTDEYFLYYSGSEQAKPYSEIATPAPRGHRVKSSGRSGKVLMERLLDSARRQGVEIMTHTRATRLVIDADSRVTGLECQSLGPLYAHLLQRLLLSFLPKINLYAPLLGRPWNALVTAAERHRAVNSTIMARRGVILAAGGFIFNRKLLTAVAPRYLDGRPIGTIADDGSGLLLGMQAGAATAHLGNVSVWRFMYPPEVMVDGVLVATDGRRRCNELLYGAAIGRHIVEEMDGRGWLIVDHAIFEQARRQMPQQTAPHQRPQWEYLLSRLGHVRATTLGELARKVGVDERGLEQTVSEYNARGRSGEPDPYGKGHDHLRPLETPPYYAFDMSLKNSPAFPAGMITLGGLVVDEITGLVKRADGSTIAGLYAAGRTAVGVCSASYVSGLSIADAIFSGRRAGGHAASQVNAMPVADTDQARSEV